MYSPEQFLRVSTAVTQLLSESENLPATLRQILRVAASELRFETGNVWRADYESLELRCIAQWSEADRFPKFRRVSLARTFQMGVDIPGTVWSHKAPLWTSDVIRHPNFPRASVAEAEGLHTGVGFPLLHGSQVLGMGELFTTDVREEDGRLLAFLLSLGQQIGLYLRRLRAEEALTGAEAQFELLAHTALDAIITIDEDSNILFVNPAAERIFGYLRDEMQGQKLMMLMPDYLRHVHEHALKRYVETGRRHVSWEGVRLPALHKLGYEFPVEIAFSEVVREAKRYFSGYVRPVPEGPQAL